MKRIIRQIALLSMGIMMFATAHAQVTNSLNSASLAEGKGPDGRQDKPSRQPVLEISKANSQDSGGVKEFPNRGETSNGTLLKSDAPVTGSLPDLSRFAALYRVSANDVLDIHLDGMPSRQSTLFTVSQDGKVDYPLVSQPIAVVGLTPEEIAARVSSLVKMYDRPKVAVTVREYASHFVIVTGSVGNPGSKSLRREAVPLFAILSESEPRQGAVSVTVYRHGRPNLEVSLSNQNALATLITSGDLIVVNREPIMPAGFLYFAGGINSPGQKDFYEGMTLSQAVLMAGGIKSSQAHNAKVYHRSSDGRLMLAVYDLSSIDQGTSPDPELKTGDRIEIIP